MIHGQRRELMKAFEGHLHERRAFLESRRAVLNQRLRERAADRDSSEDFQGKKGLQDRRQAARERFEKARERIRQEREQQNAE